MTRTITIRSCYISIAVWIAISLVALTGVSHHAIILNSFANDENGCRESLLNNGFICPDPEDMNEQGLFRAIMESGNPVKISEYNSGYMATPEEFNNHISNLLYVYVIGFIGIQIFALIFWNEHYKWFKVEMKSCWGDKKVDETS